MSLEEDGNVNLPDDFDDTPLHWAVRLWQEAAAKVLMEAGAELNNGDKMPLHDSTEAPGSLGKASNWPGGARSGGTTAFAN
jgi:hypothetical protein